jgi:tRNA 2-thiouridine synthesizing protein A
MNSHTLFNTEILSRASEILKLFLKFHGNNKETLKLTLKDANNMSEVHKTLDARGLSCPMPVLRSKKALKELDVGQVLEILSTDPGSMADIPAWIRTTGQELLTSEELGPKDFRYLVKRLK